ncbi:MAG: hypothetical protein QM503_10680 [Bacteroidota bacterium]
MDYPNMDWTPGNVSIPGIFQNAFCIPKTDIVSWPAIVDAPADAAAAVTLAGAFTLVALKTWKKINHIDKKAIVVCEPQGEERSQTFLNKGTLKTSLTTEDATAFAMKANNDDLVYAVREKNSKKMRILGNEMFSTLTKPTLALGGEPTSERGVSLEIEVTDGVPAPFFAGPIMTDDGDVNL